MNDKNSYDSVAWTLCAPGTLQTLTGQLRTVQRRKAVHRIVTPLAFLAVLGVGSWTTSQMIRHSKPIYGGISCHEAQANLELFSSGELPDALSEKMAAHLRECPTCQALFREMNQQLPDEVGTSSLYTYSILASMKSVR